MSAPKCPVSQCRRAAIRTLRRFTAIFRHGNLAANAARRARLERHETYCLGCWKLNGLFVLSRTIIITEARLRSLMGVRR